MKLGCDPEWELRNKSGFLNAAQAFINASPTDEVGLDGCSNTGEFRPAPGTPAFIVSSIREHLRHLNRAVGPNVQAYGGSGIDVPLGGHIHFSGVPNSVNFRELLDRTVSLPLEQVSHPNSLHMRKHVSNYGQLSAYRDQMWGWEYRTPLSWLAHPIICRGALEMAWQAAILWTNLSLASNKATEIIDGIRNTSDLLSTIDDRGALLVLEKYLDYLKEMDNKGVYLEDIEMFQAWKVRKARFNDRSNIPNAFSKPNFIFNNFSSRSYTDDDVALLHNFYYGQYSYLDHDSGTDLSFDNCGSSVHFSVIDNEDDLSHRVIFSYPDRREAVYQTGQLYWKAPSQPCLPSSIFPDGNDYSMPSERLQFCRDWDTNIRQNYINFHPFPNDTTNFTFTAEVRLEGISYPHVQITRSIMEHPMAKDYRFPAFVFLFLALNFLPLNVSILTGSLQEATAAPEAVELIRKVETMLSYRPKRSTLCAV